jgi:hypothetical protein
MGADSSGRRNSSTEDQQLIGIEEIDGVTYLWLSRPDQEEDEQC